MTAATVLITCVQLQQAIETYRQELEGRDLELILPVVAGQQLNAEEMSGLIRGVDGIIAGDDEITRDVLESADRLKIVSKWGIGIDNIDLAAATELGIRVTNTPGMFSDEVADVVIGYVVMLTRHLQRVDRAVRSGGWAKPVGASLADLAMGIVGLGDIGREVAKRAIAMKMRVIGAEIRPDHAAEASAGGVEIADVRRVLQEADVVSLNCPLTEATHHMIDAAALAEMKPGAWLINTARGALIDEDALVRSIGDGHLAGAALDVFEKEPLPEASFLRKFDNVILGSHNSSNTAQAVDRTSRKAIENLLAGLAEVS